MWSVCRMTGCWPLPVRGGDSLPVTLAVCPRCAAVDVCIVHAICHCAGFAPEREWAHSRCRLPQASNAFAYLLVLFGRGAAPAAREVHIEMVGRILVEGCGPEDAEDLNDVTRCEG